MKTKNIFWGAIFILIGITILANRILDTNFFNISTMWPVIILLIGILFEVDYFINRNNAGILVPGGILTIIGLLYLFETFTNWSYSSYTYPIYALSVAIGLLQLYIFGGKKRGVLVATIILFLITAINFLSVIYNSLFYWIKLNLVVPLIFIIIGLYILLRGSIFKRQ